ncbi:unnamed protein product [Caenorhabditis auriculariae]|uniref:Uncharacterized protein n=1 Tax=Caenorhabditis auriculariae TaxID=2777116 RepID=A0A8S1GVM4_9PELO|nr:unnamed protein product [Caenorhabditis auriculariae]
MNFHLFLILGLAIAFTNGQVFPGGIDDLYEISSDDYPAAPKKRTFFAKFKNETGAKTNKLMYKNNADYDLFLSLLEGTKNEAFVFDPELYLFDSKGLPYITCLAYDSSVSSVQTSLRCQTARPGERPSCFASYDAKNNEMKQGCYVYKISEETHCDNRKLCEIKAPYSETLCCCVGKWCNLENRVLYKDTALNEVFNKTISPRYTNI